jgi:site-specific DNA recombinase
MDNKMAQLADKDRKCALYVRVSTSNQVEEGESLDEQSERLINYCKYKGWKTHTIYREEGFSGKDTNRPAFRQMMRDILKANINTVIVKKIDRLSRSIIDFENIYKTLDERGVDLISLQENFDTCTALGRGVIRIVLVFAQLEREQTSERTVDMMGYRAKQGLFNGGYPRLGYDIDYENKQLVQNESEIPIVHELFKTYLELGSLSETAKAANNKGYRMKEWTSKDGRKHGGVKFQKASISRLLKDPAFIGQVKYKGALFNGQHKAILDEELFNRVQLMLNKNNQTKTGYRQDSNKFLFKSLVSCGACKSGMTPSFSTSRGKPYFYYRCTSNNDSSRGNCPVGSVNAHQLEGMIVHELKRLGQHPQIIEEAVEIATKQERIKVVDLKERRFHAQSTLNNVDRKAKGLLALIGTPKNKKIDYLLGEIENVDNQAKELKKEIETLDFEIANFENRIVSAEIIQNSLHDFSAVYDNLTQSEKYDLAHLLIKKLTYFEEDKADENGNKKGHVQMELWELQDLRVRIKAKPGGFAESINWLPGTDSNR